MKEAEKEYYREHGIYEIEQIFERIHTKLKLDFGTYERHKLREAIIGIIKSCTEEEDEYTDK